MKKILVILLMSSCSVSDERKAIKNERDSLVQVRYLKEEFLKTGMSYQEAESAAVKIYVDARK